MYKTIVQNNYSSEFLSLLCPTNIDKKQTSNKSYLWHNDSASINLSHIEMSLSALNQQRKAFDFITTGNCPLCNAVTESVSHYFLHCPNFAAPMRQMLQDFNDVLPELTHNLKEINLTIFMEFYNLVKHVECCWARGPLAQTSCGQLS